MLDHIEFLQPIVDIGVSQSVVVDVVYSDEGRSAGVVPGAITISGFGYSLVKGDDGCAEAEDHPVFVCFRIKSRYVFLTFDEVVGSVGESIADTCSVGKWSDNIPSLVNSH